MNESKRRMLKIIVCVFVVLKTISIINMFIVKDPSILLLWPIFITAVPFVGILFLNFFAEYGVILPSVYILLLILCAFLLIFRKKESPIIFGFITASLFAEGIIILVSTISVHWLSCLGGALNLIAAGVMIYINKYN